MPPARKVSNFIPAMLAKETTDAFDDKDWIFEIKWDGYRAICEVDKGEVKLYSRNGLSFENDYPIIFDALKEVKDNVVLDGEIVVLNDKHQPEFQLLQHYDNNCDKEIIYYVFDILKFNGKDACSLPLLERKRILKNIKFKNKCLRYSDHVVGDGKSFFELTKEKNLEGMMAKKSSSSYFPGRRTTDWLKVKHSQTQEAVIAGFTPPSGSRKYFGAIVLGVYNNNKLQYIGNSGSGFNFQSLKEVYEMLVPLITSSSPFAEKIKDNSKITWVKPKLICEIKFSEITNDGKLRHPIFLHIRNDKHLKEVTMANTKTIKGPEEVAVKKDDSNNKIFVFGKDKVKTTNLSKVYFPDDGITKGDVINYYISMSKYILPYLKGRPESLLRNPGGIKDKAFFHKDAGEDAPSFVKRQLVHSDSSNKEIDYIVCNNQATLTYMNNMGCIEINPWHSTMKALDFPDYLIIDIDPSDQNDFEQVIEAANVVKEILDRCGATSYCKTSGSSGLHIYVPTKGRYTYEQVKDFAFLVCMMAQEQIPDFTTLERNLKKRGDKHIYMDYLQNRKGQTIASVYSLRPKPGATVSTPLLWKEVKSGLKPSQFHIKNIEKRVKKMGDIFSEVLGKGIDLNNCLKKLEH